MAITNQKATTSFLYWIIVVFGVLSVFFVIKTVNSWGNPPTVNYPSQPRQDDIVSLEKSLNAISKDSIDSDMSELESMQ